MGFEEKFKEELQRREIKPSIGSWEKLQGRLDEDSQPKEKGFAWLWKAVAVAVLFFGLGTMVQNPFDAPQVVEETPREQILEQENSVATEGAATEEAEEKRTEKKIFSEGNFAEKQNIKPLEIPQQQPPVKVDIADVQSQDPLKMRPEQGNTKALAEVTDAEINALLSTAREELSQDSLAYAAQLPAAEDLLKEVEFELDESFRRKVFEVLKEGYSKARTAVANRNF